MAGYLSIKEFAKLGYLQEVNRLLLHRLGLALEVSITEDGNYTISGVEDFREDPEGGVFGSVNPDRVRKSEYVARELNERDRLRFARFGWIVQPAGIVVPSEPGT